MAVSSARIEIEVTNQVVASQTGESIVIASKTDPAFDKPGPMPTAGGRSRRCGSDKAEGALKPYQGGISYTKISRLAFQPGALLVEIHSAFIEPNEWFQGCADLAVEVQRHRPGPDPQAPPRAGTPAKNDD